MFVGLVNRILSLRVWEPLVRLCFIMYLAHPVVMGLFLFNLKQMVYLTELIGVSDHSQAEAETEAGVGAKAKVEPELVAET